MVAAAVVIRPAKDLQEVTALVDLTADAFSEEIRGSGLTKQQWVQLELEHLSAFPSMWNHIGVAVEDGRVKGAAVVRFQGDRERHMTVWEMVRRLGCWATLYSIISNQLLKDNVSEGEALIDSIAVAPDCQGRGFGSALLKWCQATVAAEAPPGTVSNLYLWVAESNTAAAMYSRAGFHVVKRTRDDWTAPLMHLILHSFLGYGAWHRMVKGIAGAKTPMSLAIKTRPLRPMRSKSIPEPPSPLTPTQKMVCRLADGGKLDNTGGGEWLISATEVPLPGDKAASDEQLIAEFEHSVGIGGKQPRVATLPYEPACSTEDMADASPPQSMYPQLTEQQQQQPAARHPGRAGQAHDSDAWEQPVPQGYQSAAPDSHWYLPARPSRVSKRRGTGEAPPGSEHVIVSFT